MNPRLKHAFSWTELLVLVAVIGFLAAVIYPTIHRGRQGSWRSMDASNIRQIGQAALIYANDNREQLPGLQLNAAGERVETGATPNIHALAAALARQGGLNDGYLWISHDDQHPNVNAGNLGPILRPGTPRTLCPEFAKSALSFQFIAGLNTGMLSTTPIAFTRGLQPDGQWAADRHASVRGTEGGHIVFLGGNVQFYNDLRPDGGRLVTPRGARTANILETIDSEARVFSYPTTATGAISGLPGIAP